jgi:hypothetical protein
MIKEFVPETRSDKKDAEIARLREQVRVLRTAIKTPIDYDKFCVEHGMTAADQLLTNNGWDGKCAPFEFFEQLSNAALAATEEK